MSINFKMKPCKQCGECCKAEPCQVAIWVGLENQHPCEALEKSGNLYFCGLALHPQKYLNLGPKEDWKDDFIREHIKRLLGIGMGCDSW